MSNMPNFLEVWVNFFLSGAGISAMFVTMIMFLIYLGIDKYYSKMKEEKNEERNDEIKTMLLNYKFAAKFFLLSFLILTTLATSMTQLDINFFFSDANKQWFVENQEKIYEDVEEKEVNVSDIKSIVRIDSESDLNYHTKKILMYRYLEGKYKKNIYLVEATIENKNGKKELVEMLVMLEIVFERKNKAFIKDTTDGEQDVGEKLLYGKIFVSEMNDVLITN
jgi:hypothetical protein